MYHRVGSAGCQARRCLFPAAVVYALPRDGVGTGATERSGERGGDLFSSEGRVQSRHFVFRTLCNILE